MQLLFLEVLVLNFLDCTAHLFIPQGEIHIPHVLKALFLRLEQQPSMIGSPPWLPLAIPHI